MNMRKPRLISLKSAFEADLHGVPLPFSDYPRPQMKRASYLCLNGIWDFSIENSGKTAFSGEILVPFVPESRISGVMREITKNDRLIYKRTFLLTEDFVKSKVLLHFGACDQFAEVYINGKLVGQNEGGYLPFGFDITDYVPLGENFIKVIAADPLDRDLPYGKQTDRRGGMWYTKISGIWQTVWLESVPEHYIRALKITPDLKGIDLEVVGGCDEKTLTLEGKDYRFKGAHFRLNVENPSLWTPEHPYLYSFTLASGEDSVESYFGLRTVEIKQIGFPLICLNGKPIFCHALLDQGYFSCGIFLPASERGYTEDILKMKSCGFNMLRKHIKLEPERFYYNCDRYGMLVFQDMINSGKYSFLLDTALPTVFLKRGISHRASPKRKAAFEKTCEGIINGLYNHPSVVCYTIFNEGWGQFSADAYYKRFKALDPTRIYDTTSGWFKEKQSDVESEHIYFKPIKLKPSTDRPLVLSEFGGYACKIEGHSFNLDQTYGYRTFDTPEAFENALIALYENEILPAIGQGLCAAVLTQLSDVEDETNGLLTYDRMVLKVHPDRMSALARKLFDEFNGRYH